MGARKYAGEIKVYNFSSFGEEVVQGSTYQFKSFEGSNKVDQVSIAREHGNALTEGFDIIAEVKKQRGHAKYEVEQYNLKIDDLVARKLEMLKEEVMQKAYLEGLSKAKQEIESQFKENFEQQVIDLTGYVDFVKQQQKEVINKSKKDILKIVQMVTHWILQKEINTDYATHLIPLILNKVQDEQNIVIKVDVKSYEKLSDADSIIKTKFQTFKGLKIIPDEHITFPGVVIETDSNIFDATQEAQKQLIENLFSSLMESSSGSNNSES